ncbi:MAG: hypothetical protein IJO46_09260 [Thermoguttaceae bacterium]|nr:hypothetical protein [Thermoguttaceae bacterium]MBQ8286507.1 hypothetical protein [Thermoguttaceae bacterium]
MADQLKPLEKTSSSLFDALSADASVANASNAADELVSKRASVLAIVSAVAGALSFLSLLNLGFLFFSAFGALAAIFALAAIAKSGGELVGRSWALGGLALALAGAISGPLCVATYRADFDAQADEFCQIWFDAAKKGDVLTLRQLTRSHWDRPPIIDENDAIKYWATSTQDEDGHRELHSFLANPTILTLAALGDRVKPTFYATESQTINAKAEVATRVYAVTVAPEKEGEAKQTFFLKLTVERRLRKTARGEKSIGWNVHPGDWRPVELDENGRPILKVVE